ncbi:MAG: NnrU family protein [Desulfobacterales bacterium]|nr:NnrU family protein [Desulfobacterales bacterium]
MQDRWISYFLLAVMWTAYCAIHSLLISPSMLQGVRKRYPVGHRYHRLIFNIFSTLSLIPIVVYTLNLKAPPLFTWEGPLRWLQALFILTGIALIVAGAAHYDFKEFLGLSQISRSDTCTGIGAGCELNTAGILGVVRHPWYTAVFLLLWARDLDPAAIIVNTILSAYILIGTHLEESKLTAVFGTAYRDYQRNVSMFLPVKWLRSKFDRV